MEIMPPIQSTTQQSGSVNLRILGKLLAHGDRPNFVKGSIIRSDFIKMAIESAPKMSARLSLAELRELSDKVTDVKYRVLLRQFAYQYLISKKDLIKAAYVIAGNDPLYLVVLKEPNYDNWIAFHDVNDALEYSGLPKNRRIFLQVVSESLLAEFQDVTKIEL